MDFKGRKDRIELATSIQIVDSLKRGIPQLEAERDAVLEQLRFAYDEQIESLRRAITALQDWVPSSLLDQRPATVTPLAVSDEKLNQVRQDLIEHPRSRQSDIVRRTKLNSGTVSVALRRLRIDCGVEGQQIRPAGKEDGSQVWELVPAVVAA